MATRILAQLLVAGGTVVFRAAAQAWQQALINAQKTGVASEAVKQATKTGQMSIQEAYMILGIKEGTPWSEVMQKYQRMFETNEKQGSFYLVSKVYRAKEALEQVYPDDERAKAKDTSSSSSSSSSSS